MDNNNLILGRKAVSIAASILILINVFIFIAGYFWGYRRASADLQINLNQVDFVDRIKFNSSRQFEGSDTLVVEAKSSTSDTIDSDTQNVIVASSDLILEPQVQAETDKPVNDYKYYAELIGFGHLKSAQVFVDKMKQKGYPVLIKKRISKKGNGKTVNWYQAVTKNFDNVDQLNQLLETIKKVEHLQDIKIKRF